MVNGRDELMNHYHCCASCRHFSHRNENGKNIPVCTRLKYDTRPDWQFSCWDPKPRVKQMIYKKKGEGS